MAPSGNMTAPLSRIISLFRVQAIWTSVMAEWVSPRSTLKGSITTTLLRPIRLFLDVFEAPLIQVLLAIICRPRGGHTTNLPLLLSSIHPDTIRLDIDPLDIDVRPTPDIGPLGITSLIKLLSSSRYREAHRRREEPSRRRVELELRMPTRSGHNRLKPTDLLVLLNFKLSLYLE